MSGQKLILKLSTSHLKLITSVNKLAISTTEPSTHINMELLYVNLKSPRFLSIPGEMEDGDVQCIDTYRQHLLLFGLMTSLLSDPQFLPPCFSSRNDFKTKSSPMPDAWRRQNG